MKFKKSPFTAALRLNLQRTLLTHISGSRRIICDDSTLDLLEQFNEPKSFNGFPKNEDLKKFKLLFSEARILVPSEIDETTELTNAFTTVYPEAAKAIEESGRAAGWIREGGLLEAAKRTPLPKKLILSKSLTFLKLPYREVMVTHPLMPKLFLSEEFWSLALSFSKGLTVAGALKRFADTLPQEKILAACDFLVRKKILIDPEKGDRASVEEFLKFTPIDKSLSIQTVVYPLFQWDERVPTYTLDACVPIKREGAIATIGPCHINLLTPPLQYIAERAGIALQPYSLVEDYFKLSLHSWMAILVSPVVHASRLYEALCLQEFEKGESYLPKIVAEVDYKIHQIRAHSAAPIVLLSLGRPALFSSIASSNSLVKVKKILAELNFQILDCLKKYENVTFLDEESLAEHFPTNILDDEYTSTPHHAVINVWNFGFIDRFVDRSTELPPYPTLQYPPSLFVAEEIFKTLLRYHVEHPIQMIIFNPDGLLWSEDFLKTGFSNTDFLYEKGVHEALTALRKEGVLLACITPDNKETLKGKFERVLKELFVSSPGYWIKMEDLAFIKSGKNPLKLLKEIIKGTKISEKNILWIEFSEKGKVPPQFTGQQFIGNKWDLRRYLLTSIQTRAIHSSSEKIKKREPKKALSPSAKAVNFEQSYEKVLRKMFRCSSSDLRRVDDMRLLGLDSLGGLELLLQLEKELGVKIKDYDLTSAILFSKSRLFKALLSSYHDRKETPLEEEMTYDEWCSQTVAGLLSKNFASPKNPWIIKYVNSSKPFDYTYITWETLRKRATFFLSYFQKCKVAQGEIVTILLPQGLDLAAAEVGAILGGIIPSICPFPNEKLSEESFGDWFGKIVEKSNSKLIVCDPSFHELISKLLRQESLFIPILSDISQQEELPPPVFPKIKNDALVILQHSSGTTGLKKGVVLNNRALLAQAWHLTKALKLSRKDVIVSWLPLYHDMGLIGCFLIPLLHSIPVVMMSPFDWVKDPSLLFTQVTEEKGTLCWLPNFAFHFMSRRISLTGDSRWDLSSLRLVINASEPITQQSLVNFYQKFSEIGLKYSSLSSAYGMAEITLIATTNPVGRFPSIITVQRTVFQKEGKIKLWSGAKSTFDGEALELVSSGQLLSGAEIKIVDSHGNRVTDRVGEIWIKSDSAMNGYFKDPEATLSAYHKGWYKSGDLGFIYNKELYVTGRKKDMIIIAGQNFFPHEVEEIVSSIQGIRPGRVVAFGIFDENEGTEKLVVMAETAPSEKGKKRIDPKRLKEEIRAHLLSTLFVNPFDVVLYDGSVLLKSTSGKISRARNREHYLVELKLAQKQ